MESSIKDWDRAYANAASIDDPQSFVDRWPIDAETFRQTMSCELDIPYGSGDRQKIDLFHPEVPSKGLLVFVHGGYWYRFDKSFWSHLAAGPLSNGWHVAMPSYTLTPTARIRDITKEIATAISLCAKQVEGPIILAGHSAGGHLVSRQICSDTGLPANILDRIKRTISISGVHDLRPILRLDLNGTIGLDAEEVYQESPALLAPFADGVTLDCIAGGDELPEFRRQNALLANVWQGLGARTSCHEVSSRHHFDIIDDLTNPEGLICSLMEDQ